MISLAQIAKIHGGVRRPGSRLPKMIYPRAIEREYFADMMRVVAVSHRPIVAAVPQLLQLASMARAERGRFDVNEAAEAKSIMDKAILRTKDPALVAEVERLANDYARRTSMWNAKQIDKIALAAYRFKANGLSVSAFAQSPALKAIAADFVAGNTRLITGIGSRAADDVAGIVIRAFQLGTRASEIGDAISKRLGVDDRRAALIARDQIGSLNGQVNAARQESLGIVRFTWRTLNDERVRDSHEALDGEEFRYDKPPLVGLPGEDINCRCYAEPIIE